MNIGITGINGFLGRNLKNFLEQKQQIVSGFDQDDKKYRLFDLKSLKKFVKDKDIIVQVAGLPKGTPPELIKVNVLGTVNLLEAIKEANPKAKLILISSFQVYQTTERPKKINEEESTPCPSFDGLSKKMAEEVARKYYEIYGVKSVILRITNIFGPGCRPYYNSIAATFLDLIKKGEKLTITGSGEQARDFIFASDVCAAIFLAARSKVDGAEIFNVCTGRETSINQLVKTMEKVLNKKAVKNYFRRKEPVDFLIGDPGKAEKMLGFKAEVGFKEGIRKI